MPRTMVAVSLLLFIYSALRFCVIIHIYECTIWFVAVRWTNTLMRSGTAVGQYYVSEKVRYVIPLVP